MNPVTLPSGPIRRPYPRRAARLCGLVLALGAGVGSGRALAQSAPPRDPFEAGPQGALLRDDVAGARKIPGYTAPGLDLGGMHLAPSLTLRSEASSNVFNRSGGGRGDVWATVAPAVLAVGQTGTARFVVDGRASLARYARLSGYNTDTWALRGQAARPVGGGLTLALSGAAARRLEPPFEAAGANPFDGGVVLVDQLQAGLGVRVDLGRTRLTGAVDLARTYYLPVLGPGGAMIGQAFRDERATGLSLRVDRSLGAGRIAFAEASLRQVRSLHPGTAPDRTGRAGEALVGLKGEFSHLVMGELAAGWQWRNYRSPALRNYRGLAWRARLEWYATPLVTFTLAGRRDLVNSPLPGAAGVVVDRVEVKALYEVKRNLNLVLSAAHVVERYRDLPGASPTIRTDTAGIEATYAANRHVQLGLTARYRDRQSASFLLPRQGHAVEGGLFLRFSL